MGALEDPSGRRIRYHYTDEGYLARVTYQDGTERHYFHEEPLLPGFLTSVANEDMSPDSPDPVVAARRFARFTYYLPGDRFEGWVASSELAQTNEQPGQSGIGQGRVILSYSHTEDGRLRTSIEDARGYRRELEFPSRRGRLKPLSVRYADQRIRQVTGYDVQNRPLALTDEGGIRTTYRYGRQQVLERAVAAGTPQQRSAAFEYSELRPSLVSRIVEPSVYTGLLPDGQLPSRVTTLEYVSDPANPGTLLPLIESVRVDGYTPSGEPVSQQTTATWSATEFELRDGRRVDATMLEKRRGIGPEGSIRFEYHTTCPGVGHCGRLGQVARKVIHLGTSNAVHSYEDYDPHGRVLREVQPNGLVYEYEYDLRGRKVHERSISSRGELVVSWTFSPGGDLIAKLGDARGAVYYEYDYAQQLTALEDGAGNRLEFGYDLAGNRVSATYVDPTGTAHRSVAWDYDARNRVRTVTDGDSVEHYRYDDRGLVVGLHDALGRETRFSYDALRQMTARHDALSIVKRSAPVRYAYDVHGQLVSVTDPLQRETRYFFDDLGNMLEVKRPESGVFTYQYDGRGNVIAKIARGRLVEERAYDLGNRLTRVGFPGRPNAITYEYDDPDVRGRGRLTRMVDRQAVTSYRYDDRGNVVEMRQATEEATSSVYYGWDKAGRRKEITYPSGLRLTFSYDPAGRIDGVDYDTPSSGSGVILRDVRYLPYGPASHWELGNGVRISRTFDHGYRLTGIDSRPLKWDIGRDAVGNVVSIDDRSIPDYSQSFEYDVLDRMVVAHGLFGTRLYEFDTIGNRVGVQFRGAITGLVPAYEAAGVEFKYEDGGRLTEIWGGDKALGVYAYNGHGQRIRKTTQSTTSIFVYDLDGKLLSVLGEDAHPQTDYIYLGRMPVVKVDWSTGGAVVSYLIAGEQGLPLAVFDDHGELLEQALFTPYGAPVNGARVPLRFEGQFFDREIGLHYNYFRHYEPAVGRYTQPDPISLAEGVNAYAYAGANPLRYSDPLGLLKVTGSFGGMAFFGGFGGVRDTGFGFDLTGNVCVVITRCDARRGVGMFAGLGGTLGIEAGDFCAGDNRTSSGARIVDLGLGTGGAITGLVDESGRPTGGAKAFGGLAVGAGGISGNCELRTICGNPFR